MSLKKENDLERLNERLWDSRSKIWGNKRFSYFRTLQRRLVDLLNINEEQHFLDLGCGIGQAVRYAASLANDRGEFDGIDISSKMIEKAIANSSGYKNVHFYHTSAQQLPFRNNHFDFIICSNSFHHYSDPNKVLLEVFRVLKPRGRIYILDTSGDGFIARISDRLANKIEPEHVKIYSSKEYKTLFCRAGLNYIASLVLGRMVVIPVKVQIGEKPSHEESA